MIQEFEDHVKKLRQSYVDASMSQRIEIARQRTTYPDCGPNVLCNTIGALEALARAVLLEIKISKDQPKMEAYGEIKMKNTTTLLSEICNEKNISQTDFFGPDWELIEYAEKYRNLLTHEAAFLREGYSSRLIGACQRAFKKIEQEWITV